MTKKSVFITIVGRPNVGKSTLMNRIVGEKVAIVSDKPQTTRNRITGVLTKEEVQLVFMDTPGWHKPHTRLSDFMVREVTKSLAQVDVALVVLPSNGTLHPDEVELLNNIKLREIPFVVVLNKIDLLKQKEEMFPKIQEVSEKYNPDEVIPISAKNGQGIDTLIDVVTSYAKPAPHYFGEDDYTDQPERVLISEIIREKLLRNLWEELPHGIAVGVEQMKERENGNIVDIDATIYCERASHKGMIIGKKGSMLKKVGTQSREDLEEFLGIKVNLQLWVKIKEDWRNRENILRQLGFD